MQPTLPTCTNLGAKKAIRRWMLINFTKCGRGNNNNGYVRTVVSRRKMTVNEGEKRKKKKKENAVTSQNNSSMWGGLGRLLIPRGRIIKQRSNCEMKYMTEDRNSSFAFEAHSPLSRHSPIHVNLEVTTSLRVYGNYAVVY